MAELRSRRTAVTSSIVALFMIAMASVGYCYYKYSYIPLQYARSDYEMVYVSWTLQTDKLNKAIDKADKALSSKEEQLDNNYYTSLEDARDKAKKARKELPTKETLQTVQAYKEAQQKIANVPNYDKEIQAINTAYKALAVSRKQYKQVVNPTQSILEQRLGQLPNQGIQPIISDSLAQKEGQPSGYELLLTQPLQATVRVENYGTAESANKIRGHGRILGSLIISVQEDLPEDQKSQIYDAVQDVLTKLDSQERLSTLA